MRANERGGKKKRNTGNKLHEFSWRGLQEEVVGDSDDFFGGDLSHGLNWAVKEKEKIFKENPRHLFKIL